MLPQDPQGVVLRPAELRQLLGADLEGGQLGPLDLGVPALKRRFMI